MEPTLRERTQRFFTPLLERNPSGIDWLPLLLRATPAGVTRLGELVDDAGSLDANLTLPALEGRRTCFQYPVAAPPELTAWLIDHAERLTWPEHAELSSEVRLLRRALVADDPPGSRSRAQKRARELVPVRSAFAREWWRFEETFQPDCLLMSGRLVLSIVAADRAIAPVSEWYPQRSLLIRGLEAAERLAAGERRWGTVLLSQAPIELALRESLTLGAPHRNDAGRDELAAGYLGNLTCEQAAAAVAPTLAQR